MVKSALENLAYLALTAAAVVMAWSIFTAPRVNSDPTPALEKGSVLPAFTLFVPPADTAPAVVPGEKTTLLIFFATSCVYCRASLATYRKVASEYCDLAMTFVILDKPASQIDAWSRDNIWGEGVPDGCAKVRVGTALTSIAAFGRLSTPTHYLVDAERRVVTAQVGALYEIPDWLAAESRREEPHESDDA